MRAVLARHSGDLVATQARALGIAPPRPYDLGFAHNNCVRVCVRAGQKHWAHLLRTFPERYLQAERQEQELRAELGDVAILRDRSGGRSRPLTLAEFRQRLQAPNSTQKTSAN